MEKMSSVRGESKCGRKIHRTERRKSRHLSKVRRKKGEKKLLFIKKYGEDRDLSKVRTPSNNRVKPIAHPAQFSNEGGTRDGITERQVWVSAKMERGSWDCKIMARKKKKDPFPTCWRGSPSPGPLKTRESKNYLLGQKKGGVENGGIKSHLGKRDLILTGGRWALELNQEEQPRLGGGKKWGGKM